MLVEKESKFVRFPAVQSIYVFGALTIASIILLIPYVATRGLNLKFTRVSHTFHRLVPCVLP